MYKNIEGQIKLGYGDNSSFERHQEKMDKERPINKFQSSMAWNEAERLQDVIADMMQRDRKR